VSDPQEEAPLMVGGRVLDSAAVAAWGRGWLHMEILTRIAGQLGIALLVPAGVLVEAGRRLGPDAAEAARFAELGSVLVVPMDVREALTLASGAARYDAIGEELTNATRLHVLALAEQRGWPIITDDATAYPAGTSVELIPPP
jgi:hypothetical protein